MSDEIKVFISYSHADKEFVRNLDAQLLANKVNTFLDEREIKVGDYIPEKIYEGIGTSTHLIYVISRNSLGSTWVKEELSIAKMKEKEAKGFCILPVLIDEVEIPTSILHVKYADFRDWRNPNKYRFAFLEILRAMDIEPRLLGRFELIWYAKDSGKIRKIERNLTKCIEQLDGALSSTQSFCQPKNYHGSPPHYSVVKWVFEEYYILEDLGILIQELLSEINESGDDRLAALKRNAIHAYEYGKTEFKSKSDYEKKYSELSFFMHKLGAVAVLISEIRNEVEGILLASVAMD